ncbi:MAG TPA: DNA repair protein RecO, partial [Leptolyngbyaceae cyanobacterium M65_K2018_010]|nr:DNA repair protein RecO [Leptolyngbyaceae cyanobacterium M65_K2018_010]
RPRRSRIAQPPARPPLSLAEADRAYGAAEPGPSTTTLTALEVALLQQLSKPELIATGPLLGAAAGSGTTKNQELWSRIERILRQYAQSYFERPIRSAALIDVSLRTV